MSDYSLMNPSHLKNEIKNMIELAERDERDAKELKESYDRVIDYIRETHDKNQDTVLTFEQTRDLIETLARFDHKITVLSSTRKFYLRVYKNLLNDRRWFIAAKYLRFLKK